MTAQSRHLRVAVVAIDEHVGRRILVDDFETVQVIETEGDAQGGLNLKLRVERRWIVSRACWEQNMNSVTRQCQVAYTR